MRGWGRALSGAGSLGVVLAFAGALSEAQAQSPGQVSVGAEVGWSESRRGGVGARVDWNFWDQAHLVGQGLLFFPDESGFADPGVGVDRKSWQLNANLIYDLDRRRIYVYGGGGVSYGEGSLTLNVDGVEATATNESWAGNLLLGFRRPTGTWRPYAEGKIEFWRDGEWVITSGIAVPLGGEMR